MITDNKNLLKEQGYQLQIADNYLNKLEEENILQDEFLREYQLEFFVLQNKYIP